MQPFPFSERLLNGIACFDRFKEMTMRTRSCTRCLLPMLLLLLAGLARAQERSFVFEGESLQVSNLIGQVQVRPTTGDQIRVSVKMGGQDAQADLLQYKTKQGDHSELHIIFPTKKHKKYVYPELGDHSRTSFNYHEDGQGGSWLKKIFGGDRVTVHGRGSGLELWADVLIEVPAGHALEIKQRIGGIDAAEVRSDLALDTGSGRVDARGVSGELLVDTGSGAVAVQDCRGDKISIDTGSGSVRAEGILCSHLLIDTGSGGVQATGVQADEAKIDTGSGSVALQMDRLGKGKFLVDTGSGSIVLDLPPDASASIAADTGSGTLKCDLPSAVVKNKERGEMRVVVGHGEARVTLDTGSGSITVH